MRTLTRLRWLLVLAGAGAAGACGFSFPGASQVTGQRTLAIATTPAQLTPQSPGPVLQMTALTVDPTTTNPLAFNVRLCFVQGGSDGIVASSGRDRGGGGGANGNQETLANTTTTSSCPDTAPIVAMGPQPLGNIQVNFDLLDEEMVFGAAGSRPDGGLSGLRDGGFSFPTDGGLAGDGGPPAGADGGTGSFPDGGASPPADGGTDGGSAPDGGAVDGGAVSSDAGAISTVSVSLTQVPGVELLASPLSVDLQIDYRTIDGNATQYSVKDIPITLVLPPGDVPNQNPQLQGLTFDGTAWVDGTPLPITLNACAQPESSSRFSTTNTTATCQHTIVPEYDPAQSESFHTQEADGGWQDNREKLTFYWFTTQGTFQRATSSQAIAGEATPDVGSDGIWSEPSPATASGATLWVVVRDGRGGSSWLSRELTFQ